MGQKKLVVTTLLMKLKLSRRLILEVETLVEQVISEKGKNPPAGGQVFGVVMGEVMKRLGGKVSGETVSKIVKDKLA